MRLANVEHGHSLPKKALMVMMRVMLGTRVPDIIKFMLYPTAFTSTYGKWMQDVMRGPSKWSVGERELFAAFTSRLNQCVF